MIDHRLIIKKLQGLDACFAVFSRLTGMPYVECDPETFDDQAYVFAEEEAAKEWVSRWEAMQIPVAVVKIEKEQMLTHYTGLHLIGVNRLAFHNGAGLSYLPVEQVVTIKQQEEGEKGIPRKNATLQLTMIYFLQELKRPGQSPQDRERGKRLSELEQEMIANLLRSRYILAVDMDKAEGGSEPKKQGQNLRFPYMKNQEGEILQPLFSDLWEFQKFGKHYGSKLWAATAPFAGLLPSLIKDAKGYVLNPSGVNLILSRERLEGLGRQSDEQ